MKKVVPVEVITTCVQRSNALLPQNGEPVVIEVDDDDVSILDDLLCD